MIHSLRDKDMDASIRRWLPRIWLAGCFLVYTYFMWVYGEQLLDSDNSTELIYAGLLSEENALLSDTWWYSTEIRILYFHLVMIPLFRVFTDWHVIRVIGSVINNLIMLLCYGYFCRGAGLRREYAVSAAMLILPLSDVFFKYTAYGLQYTSYISIGFATFGLLLRLADGTGNGRVRRAVALFVLSFLNGMAGMREFLVLYIPLVLTAALCLWFSQYAWSEPTSGWSVSLTKWSIAAAIAACAGYAVNITVLAGQYSFADYRDQMHYTGFSLERLETTLDGIFKNFGYHEGRVFTGYTFLNLMFGILLLITIYGAYVGVRRLLKGIIDAQTLVSVFYVLATAIYITLYLFTTMDCYDRYYIPICAFAIPTAVYGVKGWAGRHCAAEWKRKKFPIRPKTLLLMCFMVMMTGFATLNYYYLHSGDEDVTYQHRELAQILIEEGYTVGYSTYSSGGLLVELTDAAVNMHVMPVDDIQADGSIENLFEFSQRSDVAENDTEGKYFIVFEAGQTGTDSLSRYLDEDHIIYSSWRIVCYGYESYEDLLTDLGTWSYDFTSEYGYLTDGEDFLGVRYLKAGTGSSGGPDITFYAGTYRVTVSGDNLDQATVSCLFEERSGAFTLYDVETGEDEITFLFDVDETKEDCEIVVDNLSDEIITLTGVTIERQ